METKISKIEDFLVSLERQELTEQQASRMLKSGPPGEIGLPGVPNNCSDGNCAKGCGSFNIICPNLVAGCGR